MSSEGFPFGDLRVERSSLRVGVDDASVRERYCVNSLWGVCRKCIPGGFTGLRLTLQALHFVNGAF